MSCQCKEEIERKFLLTEFPSHLFPFEHGIVYQGYVLSTDEEELRIREQIPYNDNYESIYTICHKTKGDLSRTETEQPIEKAIYDCLLKIIYPKQLIKKEYQHYKLDGYIVECNRVDEYWMYCEVEFDTIEDANNFVKPDWFGAEVTSDKYYKLNQYWKMSRGT